MKMWTQHGMWRCLPCPGFSCVDQPPQCWQTIKCLHSIWSSLDSRLLSPIGWLFYCYRFGGDVSNAPECPEFSVCCFPLSICPYLSVSICRLATDKSWELASLFSVAKVAFSPFPYWLHSKDNRGIALLILPTFLLYSSMQFIRL